MRTPLRPKIKEYNIQLYHEINTSIDKWYNNKKKKKERNETKLKETQFDSRLFKALVKLLHVYDKINSEKLTDPRTFCNFVCLPGKCNKPRFGVRDSETAD